MQTIICALSHTHWTCENTLCVRLIKLNIIRSRIQTYEEGEKSTKCFLNVEKKNVSDKTWLTIKCQNGTYSSNINTIINEQKTYYKALFTSEGSNETEAEKLLEHVDKTLNLEQKHFCDAEINEKEIEDTIKLSNINKSPGDDGIICEFYKEYWYLIRREFTLVLKHIFASNTLSSSQYNAILTLLYKKGRENIYEIGARYRFLMRIIKL